MTGLEELPELTVEQSNLYTHQNRRNFTVTKEELKVFPGINFVVTINMLSTIAEYWRVNNLVGNDSVQTINRQGFQDETSDRPHEFEIFRGASKPLMNTW